MGTLFSDFSRTEESKTRGKSLVLHGVQGERCFLSFPFGDDAYFLRGKWFVCGTRMKLSFWSFFAPCFLKSKMRGNSASKLRGISQHHESEDSCGHCCRGQMSDNVYDAVSKFKPFDKNTSFQTTVCGTSLSLYTISSISRLRARNPHSERRIRKDTIYTTFWHGQCFQPPSILQDCDGKNMKN